jgi:flagellar motor switch protein FliG
MLTGKQKAQVLLSMLGDRSKSVLSLLSPTHAALLTGMIEETPKTSSAVLNNLMNEIMQKVARIRETGSLVEQKSGIADSGFSGMGLGMGMSLDDEENISESEETDLEDTGERLRTPDQIAALLSEQRPQLVAFVLSRLDDDLREKIHECLPLDLTQKLTALNVEAVPLSQHVFDSMYQAIFVLPPEDVVSETDAFGSLESQEKEEPNRVFFF